MKKQVWIAVCVSAMLGTGVLLLSGGREAEGLPWQTLNGKIETALAVQEETNEAAERSRSGGTQAECASASSGQGQAGSGRPARGDLPAQKPQPSRPDEKPAAENGNAEPEAKTAPRSTTAQAASGATTAKSSAAAESPPGEAAPGEAGRIRLNSADAAALMELPGIGAKKAQAILDYRAEHGPFRDVTELLEVKGIGAKMLEKMMPELAL